jgi:hypothetical protein
MKRLFPYLIFTLLLILSCQKDDSVITSSYENKSKETGGPNKAITEQTQDYVAPVITLIGDAQVDIIIGNIRVFPAGATALDNIDGDLSSRIVIGGDSVDTKIQGVYVVTHNVSDAAGNAALEVSRTITVTN